MTVCASCSALICETRYQRTLSSQLSNYIPQNKENTRKLGCLRFIVTGLKWAWRYVFFRVSVKISTVHDVTPGKHVILRLHRKIACELNMAYRPHVIQLHALTTTVCISRTYNASLLWRHLALTPPPYFSCYFAPKKSHCPPVCSVPILPQFLLLIALIIMFSPHGSPPFACSYSRLLIFLLAHIPACSCSHVLKFPLARIPACSYSCLLIFLLAHIPACSYSCLLIFLLAHIPASPHFIWVPVVELFFPPLKFCCPSPNWCVDYSLWYNQFCFLRSATCLSPHSNFPAKGLYIRGVIVSIHRAIHRAIETHLLPLTWLVFWLEENLLCKRGPYRDHSVV